MSVVCPTSTPLTSVMALFAPVVPSKGTPRSRARGLVCAASMPDNIMTAAANEKPRTEIRDMAPPGKQAVYRAAPGRMVRCLVRHCYPDPAVQSGLGTHPWGKHGSLEKRPGYEFDWGSRRPLHEEEITRSRAGH